MLARLDAARARQRAFVADAAHELRSPLASMRIQLEVAQRLRRRADCRHGDDLLTDATGCRRLVDDLLLLARLDERGGAAGARGEPVECASLLANVVEAVRRPVPVEPSTVAVAVGRRRTR